MADTKERNEQEAAAVATVAMSRDKSHMRSTILVARIGSDDRIRLYAKSWSWYEVARKGGDPGNKFEKWRKTLH